MTDWMLYDFAKSHNTEEIQHRIEWYKKQSNAWLGEFSQASNQMNDCQQRAHLAEQQVKCYARQAQELAQLAQENKLKGE